MKFHLCTALLLTACHTAPSTQCATPTVIGVEVDWSKQTEVDAGMWVAPAYPIVTDSGARCYTCWGTDLCCSEEGRP